MKELLLFLEREGFMMVVYFAGAIMGVLFILSDSIAKLIFIVKDINRDRREKHDSISDNNE